MPNKPPTRADLHGCCPETDNETHPLSCWWDGHALIDALCDEVEQARQVMGVGAACVAVYQERIAALEGDRTAWYCAKCKKPMQFFDGICFACNGGKDPGD
jgi:hypothetical protein